MTVTIVKSRASHFSLPLRNFTLPKPPPLLLLLLLLKVDTYSCQTRSCTSDCPSDTSSTSCHRRESASVAGCTVLCRQEKGVLACWERWSCGSCLPSGCEWTRLASTSCRTVCGWVWRCEYRGTQAARRATPAAGRESSRIPAQRNATFNHKVLNSSRSDGLMVSYIATIISQYFTNLQLHIIIVCCCLRS